MTQEEKKELLKIDLCARLPYGIATKCKVSNDHGVYFILAYNALYEKVLLNGARQNEWYGLNKIKPYLRPIDDLYREITHAGYNDGKPFVPIVECAKISHQTFEKYTLSKNDWRKTTMPDLGMQYNLEYIVKTSNMGNLEYQFSYCAGLRRFSLRDNTRNIPMGLAYQVDLFDFLNRLMIDYRGLIPAGLARSVHDLDKNPYE